MFFQFLTGAAASLSNIAIHPLIMTMAVRVAHIAGAKDRFQWIEGLAARTISPCTAS
jgi:hypothetical protein